MKNKKAIAGSLKELIITVSTESKSYSLHIPDDSTEDLFVLVNNFLNSKKIKSYITKI